LCEDERISIADGLLAGLSVRTIATELGRSPSTVSREVRATATLTPVPTIPAGQQRHRPTGATQAGQAGYSA
jgi:DNA-binding NarL/FixJ family response regulator